VNLMADQKQRLHSSLRQDDEMEAATTTEGCRTGGGGGLEKAAAAGRSSIIRLASHSHYDQLNISRAPGIKQALGTYTEHCASCAVD